MTQNLIILLNAKVQILKKSLNLNAQHNEAVYTLEAGAAEKTNEILAESTSFESPHF